MIRCIRRAIRRYRRRRLRLRRKLAGSVVITSDGYRLTFDAGGEIIGVETPKR